MGNLDIDIFIIYNGSISTIFDYSTWGEMLFYFGNHGETNEQITQFQTAWFAEGCLTQLLILHVIRTPKLPII